jgi:hypothetical protein
MSTSCQQLQHIIVITCLHIMPALALAGAWFMTWQCNFLLTSFCMHRVLAASQRQRTLLLATAAFHF